MLITLEINDTVRRLLEVLTKAPDGPRTVHEVVDELIDHAQQGVYRPRSWERQWLIQAFGEGWQQHLEPGDPYGRPESPMFDRPI